MVTKFELESVSAKGLAHDLMSHADAKGGDFADDFFASFHCVRNGRRITLRTHKITQDMKAVS